MSSNSSKMSASSSGSTPEPDVLAASATNTSQESTSLSPSKEEKDDSQMVPEAKATPKRRARKPKAAIQSQETTGEAEDATEVLVPATPQTPRTPKTTRKRAVTKTEDGKDDIEADESPSKKTRTPKSATRRKATEGKMAKPTKIAGSESELSSEDRMLLKMREDGKTWKEVSEVWTMMTGNSPGKSTLPNRYSRLMIKLAKLNPEEENALNYAIDQVYEEFEKNKWERIKDVFQEKCGAKFPVQVLQKQYKKLAESTVKSTGKRDKPMAEDSDSEPLSDVDEEALIPPTI